MALYVKYARAVRTLVVEPHRTHDAFYCILIQFIASITPPRSASLAPHWLIICTSLCGRLPQERWSVR